MIGSVGELEGWSRIVGLKLCVLLPGPSEREPRLVERERDDHTTVEGAASPGEADREPAKQQATREQVDLARGEPGVARSEDPGASEGARFEPARREPETTEAANREPHESPDVSRGRSESREASEGPVVDGGRATRDFGEVDREAPPDEEIDDGPEARSASPSSRTEEPAAPIDCTARAVERQLRAMGGGRFEIGIREAESGHWMTRNGSAPDVLEQLPWLNRRSV